MDTKKVIKKELDTRDAAAKKLGNFTARLEQVETEIETYEQTIAKLFMKRDDIIAEGGSEDGVNAEMHELSAKKQTALELRERLVDTLIPAGKKELDPAQHALNLAFIDAMVEPRQAIEEQMTRMLTEAMDVYDNWCDEVSALCKELGVRAGRDSVKLHPHAVEERLWRYVENGLLLSKPRGSDKVIGAVGATPVEATAAKAKPVKRPPYEETVKKTETVKAGDG